MRIRVRHLCLAIVPVAVLLAFSMRSDDDRHYCLGCGLIKLSESRTLLGISVPGPIRYQETVFHRLLSSTGRVKCSHRWQGFYWNHHNVHRGEIPIPFVLMNIWWSDRSFEDLLGRLRDPDKVAAILTSFDLAETFDDLSPIGDVPAFVALKSVPGAMSEEEWWERYRHFFERRHPPVKELSFVGDHQPGRGSRIGAGRPISFIDEETDLWMRSESN